MIFLDHNSTTKISAPALEKMLEVYALPLNSSSTHGLGRIANKFANEARSQIKKLLNAQNYSVIFTSSATEANNTILNGCDAEKLISSDLEHSSVANFTNENIAVEILENGQINLEDLAQKLTAGESSLTSLTIANNETGAIQPVQEASKLAHQNGGLFHCDLSQGAGKIDIDLEKINPDFASISAHKFGGPLGVGAILIRDTLNLRPLIFGGGQEKSKRAGTLNIAGIAGFGVACDLAKERVEKHQKVKILRDLLEEELQKIAGENITFFAKESSRLPNTSYFSVSGFDAQTQLINYDLNQICVSSGSACSSGSANEAKILKAMKVKKEFLSGAIRVSLGMETTKNEIEKFISVFKEFYQRNKS